jgi:hypothetical protein
MDLIRLRERFDKFGVWEKDGQRAPHKPLLLLLALGHWVAGDRSDLSFATVNAEPRRATANLTTSNSRLASDDGGPAKYQEFERPRGQTRPPKTR